MSINFENISLLVSSYMDLYDHHKKCALVAQTYMDCHFVLSLSTRTYMITICAQVAQTYKIAMLHSVHMDLYDCHVVDSCCMDLYNQGLMDLPFCAQATQHLYNCHFVLRSHWTYMITILCLGCMDLYNQHFVLRLYGPIIYIFYT